MAQIPTTALMATKRAPKRSSTSEKPAEGQRGRVWTTAACPVWSTPAAATIVARPQAAMVKRRRDLDPDLGGATAPAQTRGQPGQRGDEQQLRRHVPARPRSAVMIAAGIRRAPGNLEVDRDHVGHRALDAVGATEHPAVAGAVAERHHHPRPGHRLEGLAQRTAMLRVTGPVTRRPSAWRGDASSRIPNRSAS